MLVVEYYQSHAILIKKKTLTVKNHNEKNSHLQLLWRPGDEVLIIIF